MAEVKDVGTCIVVLSPGPGVSGCVEAETFGGSIYSNLQRRSAACASKSLNHTTYVTLLMSTDYLSTRSVLMPGRRRAREFLSGLRQFSDGPSGVLWVQAVSGFLETALPRDCQ